jgi:prepilin-type N-terminal cleavage/methylation domain-containing protein
MRADNAAGFSLMEVLVAIAILGVALSALVPLLAMCAASNAASNDATNASVLAADKMEALRSLAFDDPGMARSPPGSLDADLTGYFDTIDARFVRRWSIDPLPANPDDGVVVQVIVRPVTGRGEVRLAGVRLRSAP